MRAAMVREGEVQGTASGPLIVPTEVAHGTTTLILRISTGSRHNELIIRNTQPEESHKSLILKQITSRITRGPKA